MNNSSTSSRSLRDIYAAGGLKRSSFDVENAYPSSNNQAQTLLTRDAAIEADNSEARRKVKASQNNFGINTSYRATRNENEVGEGLEEYSWLYNRNVMRSLLREGKHLDPRRAIQIEHHIDKYKQSMQKY